MRLLSDGMACTIQLENEIVVLHSRLDHAACTRAGGVEARILASLGNVDTLRSCRYYVHWGLNVLFKKGA